MDDKTIYPWNMNIFILIKYIFNSHASENIIVTVWNCLYIDFLEIVFLRKKFFSKSRKNTVIPKYNNLQYFCLFIPPWLQWQLLKKTEKMLSTTTILTSKIRETRKPIEELSMLIFKIVFLHQRTSVKLFMSFSIKMTLHLPKQVIKETLDELKYTSSLSFLLLLVY